ncbi:MAG: DUF4382 domain-containing protein [Longimicrobiales bacterium]
MIRSTFTGRRAALALALTLAACSGSDSMLAPNQGRVRFVLGSENGAVAVSGSAGVASATFDGTTFTGTDPLDGGSGNHPRPPVKAANVTFSSILARNLDGVLVNVDMDLPASVDVITLETGRQIQLPEGELAEGTYDQVVVVMTEVSVVLWNDTQITIVPPGGGWTAIVPLCPPVEVEEGGESTVALTLDVRGAFLASGNGFHFMPKFRGCRPSGPPPNENDQ